MTAIVLNATGNWNSTSTWSPAQVPVAGDTVTVPASPTAYTVTVNVTSACASIDFTGGASSIVMNGQLTVSGSINLTNCASISSTGTLIAAGTGTLTSGGNTIPGGLTFSGSSPTFTFADAWTVTGNVTLSATTPTFNGQSITCNANLVSNAGTTFSGTTEFKIGAGSGASQWQAPSAGTWSVPITFVGGSNTITIQASQKVNGATLKYTSGTLSWGSSVIDVRGNTTFNMGAATVGGITCNAAATLTLQSTLNVTNLTLYGSGNNVFSGAYDINVGTFAITAVSSATPSHTLVAGQSVNISTAWTMLGVATHQISFASSSPGTKYNINLLNGATQSLTYVNLTDCNAIGGQQVLAWLGSVTTCFNVLNTFPTPQPQVNSGLGVY